MAGFVVQGHRPTLEVYSDSADEGDVLYSRMKISW